MASTRPNPGTVSRRHGLRGNLLLIGTPGTGKRPVAHYLVQTARFVHLDFADIETRLRYLETTDAGLRERLGHAAGGERLVITWGAGPPAQLEQVYRLQAAGFDPVWFDSDRGAACGAHFADAPRPPSFAFVDSFDADGRFRPVEAVVAELFELRAACKRPGGVPTHSAAVGALLAGASAIGSVVVAGIDAFVGRARTPSALPPRS